MNKMKFICAKEIFPIFLFTIFTIPLLESCKAKANLRYNQKVENEYSILIDSLAPAKSNNLTLGEVKKGRIDKKDPKLHYYSDSLVTKQKIVSSFDDFTIDIKGAGDYIIEVESLCNCVGFNKFLFIPLVKIQSESQIVNKELIGTSMLEETWTLPARLIRAWKFKIDKPSSLSILLYTDNSRLDETLEKSSSLEPYGPYGYTYISTEINSGFQGKYRLLIKRI